MATKKKKSGCGCLSSLILLTAVGGFWGVIVPRLDRVNVQTARNGDVIGVITELMTKPQAAPRPRPVLVTPPASAAASTTNSSTASPLPTVDESGIVPEPALPEPWANKAFRGIYISRYQITNRASEQMIRDRVRYY